MQDTPWHVQDKWFAVPAYWDPEALEQRPPDGTKVKLFDTTMREGEDAVDCHLHWSRRIRMTEILDDLGVNAISMPGGTERREQEDYVKWYRRNDIRAELSFKGPAFDLPDDDWKKKIDWVAGLGVDHCTPIFRWQIQETLSDFAEGISKGTAIEEIEKITAYAKSCGLRTKCSFVDTFRTRTKTAAEIASAAIAAGADGLYCWDSRGNSTPLATHVFVSAMRRAIGPDKDLIIQHHNDLGMATGNGMVAVEAGADWIDCGLLGLGDRGGLIATEEIAAALAIYGYSTDIRLDRLYDACVEAAKMFGITIWPSKPICGPNWNKEEGWGHRLPGDGPETSIGIAAEVIGRPEGFQSVIGPQVFYGRYPGMIIELLDIWELKHNDSDVNEIIKRGLSALISGKGSIPLDEFKILCEGVVGSA